MENQNNFKSNEVINKIDEKFKNSSEAFSSLKKSIITHISQFKYFERLKILEVEDLGLRIDFCNSIDQDIDHYNVAFKFYSNEFISYSKDEYTLNIQKTQMLLSLIELISEKDELFSSKLAIRIVIENLNKKSLSSFDFYRNTNQIFMIRENTDIFINEVVFKEGQIVSSTEIFDIKIQGVGCHGSIPHLSKSPITCGSEIVSKLNQIPSQKIDSINRCVLSFTSFDSGDERSVGNIIPDVAFIKGMFKSLSSEVSDNIREIIKKTVSGIANTNECKVELTFHKLNDEIVNDSELSRTIIHPIIEEMNLSNEEEILRIDLSKLNEKNNYSIPNVTVWLGSKMNSKTNICFKSSYSQFFKKLISLLFNINL